MGTFIMISVNGRLVQNYSFFIFQKPYFRIDRHYFGGQYHPGLGLMYCVAYYCELFTLLVIIQSMLAFVQDRLALPQAHKPSRLVITSYVISDEQNYCRQKCKLQPSSMSLILGDFASLQTFYFLSLVLRLECIKRFAFMINLDQIFLELETFVDACGWTVFHDDLIMILVSSLKLAHPFVTVTSWVGS